LDKWQHTSQQSNGLQINLIKEISLWVNIHMQPLQQKSWDKKLTWVDVNHLCSCSGVTHFNTIVHTAVSNLKNILKSFVWILRFRLQNTSFVYLSPKESTPTTSVLRHNVPAGALGSNAAWRSQTLIFLSQDTVYCYLHLKQNSV